MPKKHHRRLYTKPPSTAPTTLASSSDINSIPHHHQSQPRSVNDLLAHLRSSQTKPDSTGPTLSNALPPQRTLHPSLNAILGIDSTPLPLRPRSRVIGSRVLPRTTAGPPPPRSWLCLERSDNQTASASRTIYPVRTDAGARRGPQSVYRLPDMIHVDPRSLMHYALVALARNWEWNLVYDQYYLPTLRPTLKSLLVVYIGFYSEPGKAIGKDGLRVLFPQSKRKAEESAAASGDHAENKDEITKDEAPESWDAALDSGDPDEVNNAGVTHLDLSYAIGKERNLTMSSLERFLFSGTPLPPPPDSLPALINPQITSTIPIIQSNPHSTTTISPPVSLLLPSLTHLSLAYPSASLSTSAAWSSTSLHNLPHILSHIPTITHLSIAGWPAPPPSTSGTVARTFIRLSAATYCLKWLDVSDWDAPVLREALLGIPGEVGMEAVWGGWWRGVGTIVWRVQKEGEYGWGDEGIEERVAASWERDVARIRRGAGVSGRVRVVLE
ncbi:hypothetical protein BDZ91DRAFT_708358 [Kalaharituber pfeilii]|nr:hypothetical protein BDZ91DRAFT_708358 [Kalaharituber pfeilii]